MKRGELRMLRQLERTKQWYTPELMSTQQACAGLYNARYLMRRQLSRKLQRFEYRIDPNSSTLREARALGLL